jgi:hypothetical protein
VSTFISYSRTNSAFAVRLAKDLKSAGYDVWLDQLDIPTGTRWDDQIETALETCTTFMIILSPESMQSQNVKDEIGFAIDTGKNILPVKIKSADIPLRLRRFQYVDFTNRPYEESLKEIKSILPKREQLLTTTQIEKRLIGEEIDRMAEEIESSRSAPVIQPEQPAVPRRKAIGSPAIKRPRSRGLMFGIGVLVLLALAGILFKTIGMKEVPATAAPTLIPTVENPPTETPTAQPTVDTTQIALSQVAQSENFVINFAENSDLGNWEQMVKGTGRASKITASPANDGLVFNLNDPDLGAYYFYKPDVYNDVAIRWKVENIGKSAYNVGIVCRRTGNTWYEFRITGDGLWYLYKYNVTYLALDSGGAKALKVGKSVNEYEMICAGNQITLRINGKTMTTYEFKASFYPQGQIGFSVLSGKSAFPIDIKAMEFEVSKPAPG